MRTSTWPGTCAGSSVPAPHGRDEVLELAALAAMSGFDRTRPLWEFTLVEGLEGGGAAVVMKMHHSLTDGIGGVQLARGALRLRHRGRCRPPGR